MERNIYRDLKASYESLIKYHDDSFKELKGITDSILVLDEEYLSKNIDINNVDENNLIIFTKNGIDTSSIKNLQFVITKTKNHVSMNLMKPYFRNYATKSDSNLYSFVEKLIEKLSPISTSTEEVKIFTSDKGPENEIKEIVYYEIPKVFSDGKSEDVNNIDNDRRSMIMNILYYLSKTDEIDNIKNSIDKLEGGNKIYTTKDMKYNENGDTVRFVLNNNINDFEFIIVSPKYIDTSIPKDDSEEISMMVDSLRKRLLSIIDN